MGPKSQMTDVKRWKAPHGAELAYRQSPGAGPGLLWLGGFRSDMEGGKATALHQWAAARGRAFLRFDYSGHGASSGRFEDGTVGQWTRDALAVLDRLTDGPQVLVGSSMGGWIALNLALQRPERIAGLLLIAPAPDFTARLELELTETARDRIQTDGVWLMPTGDPAFGPTPITRGLLEDAPEHFVLGKGPVPVRVPVRIVQGVLDADVPWRGTADLVDCLEGGDVVLSLVKDGDHRLSRPQDIARILEAVRELCDGAG
jgi:pimeloyl-ACP methyl ester carboxylesterase